MPADPVVLVLAEASSKVRRRVLHPDERAASVEYSQRVGCFERRARFGRREWAARIGNEGPVEDAAPTIFVEWSAVRPKVRDQHVGRAKLLLDAPSIVEPAPSQGDAMRKASMPKEGLQEGVVHAVMASAQGAAQPCTRRASHAAQCARKHQAHEKEEVAQHRVSDKAKRAPAQRPKPVNALWSRQTGRLKDVRKGDRRVAIGHTPFVDGKRGTVAVGPRAEWSRNLCSYVVIAPVTEHNMLVQGIKQLGRRRRKLFVGSPGAPFVGELG